jgi:hypothetical protein
LVDTLLKWAQKFLEKRQATSCCFSEVFCENPENVPTNRKKGIQSRIVPAFPFIKIILLHSRAFGVECQELRLN